jgi:hypothetical protein
LEAEAGLLFLYLGQIPLEVPYLAVNLFNHFLPIKKPSGFYEALGGVPLSSMDGSDFIKFLEINQAQNAPFLNLREGPKR